MTSLHECTRCVMDESANDIHFDALGQCNYCTDMLNKLENFQPSDPEALKVKFESLLSKVKKSGKGKRYDCIVGVSGGADSAYVLYLAKQHGLRPLAVHMDNGWNSELAVNNIENLVRKLGVDLHTHVINWQEYRALQQAFFDADVIDVELLYDNAMLAVNYQLATKYGIHYILAGTNTTTEGMRMPTQWNWFKFDKKNIHAIAHRNNVKIKSMPTIGVFGYVWGRFVRRIEWVDFLDFVDYHKPKCLQEIQEKIGYRPYPYKHYESIFTRFYQGYLLPQKFGVDKRRLHLSTLICSCQMTRVEAKRLLKESPYPDPDDLKSDIDYFLKKMNWTEDHLQDYLLRPEKSHTTYPSESNRWEFSYKFYTTFLRRIYKRYNAE
ncbi:N-acetyl sugar amidotransferase [Methylotenera sp.]|uniref:N-acetyl sugar amidotransferase n=1 Tax=Methylotenera sp. TaxID=2051956 RepID=UPI0027360575|nr:N-acetyl sugar amidotransferase [Methylotenera sp.]MDP3776383.1 N-acetyl sugar amidotransferase [Methylotenera sp.]